MNWKFWKKDVEVDPSKPKMIDGWKLDIYVREGVLGYGYNNPEMKPLWKIYKWYLTKDSEKYNIEFNNGMRVLNRHDVTFMELKKEKIKDIWSNNDEG